jgi:oligosaccharide reducing-end xylanase
VKAAHPTTGLTPDYANFDGTPKATTWDAKSPDFRYDAFRSVKTWSVDDARNKKSEDLAMLSNRLLKGFGPDRVRTPGSVYTLDGISQVTSNSLAFLSCNAVAASAKENAVAHAPHRPTCQAGRFDCQAPLRKEWN